MPHAGHFICSHMCRFKLNTYVNGYIVSTVGEYVPPASSCKADLKVEANFCSDVEKRKKMEKLLELDGDYLIEAYISEFGYMEIGFNRTYETMVFYAKKSDMKCCPYIVDFDQEPYELEMEGYNSADEATEGHYALCNKYDKLAPPTDLS